MQNSHENLNSNAGSIAALTNEARKAQNDLFKTVKDYLQIGGISQPIEHITDNLFHFFSAPDHYEVDDNEKPLAVYQTYGPDTICEKILVAKELIMFLINLRDDVHRIDYLNDRDTINDLKAE